MSLFILEINKKIKKILPPDIVDFIIFFKKIIKFNKKNPEIPKDELELFKLLKDNISIVFDVGAREDIKFFEIKKDCLYYLFEPNKKFIKKLKKKLEKLSKHNIIINEFGLSNVSGDNFTYYENSQSFIINPLNKDKDTGIKYSLRKLDDYVNDNHIKYIDFLKIDTEGLDYNVMQGGTETIKNKVSFIQFEYWDKIYKYVKLLEENFYLFLMTNKKSEEIIKKYAPKSNINKYKFLLAPLDNETINIIENVFEPIGHGGNIFGIKKNKYPKIEKILKIKR